MAKLGVLISGQGTNLQAIIDAVNAGKLNSDIKVVISNRKDAYGLERAKTNKIPAFYIPSKNKSDEEYDDLVLKILEEHNVDLVVLAGYLKILTSKFIRRYENKIINIHPALLPAFGGKGYYGEHVHEAVLNAGCKVSGCTVHFVSEDIDGGPIIAQTAVKVLDTDTPKSLAERILPYEHETLIEAIKNITEKKYIIDGKRVLFL
jgi:phosphoribosylglycinamide formyltransferase-1